MDKKKEMIIIAHRGASGYLPEHTMESKAMAFAMSPHFIEQDLVLSKDNVPVVIHDVYLDAVTDVAEKFSGRNREDGRHYVTDFTYKELLELKVTERLGYKTKTPAFPKRFPQWNSSFKLHSLQDEIELIQGLSKSTGQQIGICPEIKTPAFHRENGKDISKIVLEILESYGYSTKEDQCILQCFDPEELKRIRTDFKCGLRLLQLIEFWEDEKYLKEYAEYADVLGVNCQQVLKGEDGTKKNCDLISEAQNLGMQVYMYTFRVDQPGSFESFEELLGFASERLNVDGIFTDFPDKAVEYFCLKK